MKRNCQLQYPLFFFLFSLFLFACEKDSVDYGLGEYYVDIATYQGGGAFLLDNGKSLISNEKSLNYPSGQRIWINYSLLSETTPGYDFTGRINGASIVAQGVLQGANAQTINEMKNDPIQLQSAWMGSHYLNITFSFDHKSNPHGIFLVTDSTVVTHDTVRIYFRHNTNNDPPGYKSNVIASYNLKPLLGEPKGNKTILVNFNTSNYGNKTYEFNY